MKQILFKIFLAVLLCGSLFLLWISNNYVLPIVMYHDVTIAKEHYAKNTSPDIFDLQMKFLYDNKFKVRTFKEYYQGVIKEKKFSRKSVVITFDDGAENIYTYAFPILKKYNFKAILFIPSSFIGTEGHLSYPQIKEMMDYGIEIGSHTVSHAYLPDFTKDEQEYQILESKNVLERNLNGKVDFFAYPVGGFSEDIKSMVKAAGYNAAVTTNRGFDPKNNDVYELNRVRLSDKDNTNLLLTAKFSGYYNVFRSPKNPF